MNEVEKWALPEYPLITNTTTPVAVGYQYTITAQEIWDNNNKRLLAHYDEIARADDAPARDYLGPKDAVHDRAYEVIGDIAAGRVAKPARDALGKALEKADAPPVGRAKADAGLGRAIRFAPPGITGR